MTVHLVTGGGGFIGSHLVEALVARGDSVRVLDNFSTGDPTNLLDVRDDIEVIEGDITDPQTLALAMRDVEVVFHQAALASVPRSVADPLATHRACADGTLQVLLAARDAGARRVVYAASSSAYGNSPRLPKRESDSTNPRSPYAVAKLTGEHYCAAFSTVYGLETVRLRYFNVFGPRQPPDSPYAAVIPLFLRAMVAGQRPKLHGDGRQSRDFTYIDNVIQVNLRAANAPNVSGRVYNVGCGARTSLLEIVDQLNQLLHTDLAPEFGPTRAGDVMHSEADISLARADLGYEPEVDVAEGLRRCVAWFRSDRETAGCLTALSPG